MTDGAGPRRFRGKVALVTGGGFGIGRGVCLRLAAEGGAVVAADIDKERADETVRLIEAAGGRALTTVADVRHRAQVHGMVAHAIEAFGRLDVLVANAGVIPHCHFLAITEEEWDRTIATNLTGVFLSGQAAARAMIAGGRGGRIVNVSSINAEIALPGQAHYVASKAGVRQLTKVMAVELAEHGIGVNAVAPGLTDSGHGRNPFHDPERRPIYAQRIPFQRAAEPREIAAAVAFLASDEASYMTGTTVTVDGGWTIK